MKMCLVMILVMKVFIFSKTMIICLLCPLLCGLFFFWKGAKGELSYKGSKYLINCTDTKTHRSSLKLTYDKYRHRVEKIVNKLELNPEHRAHDGRIQFATMAKDAKVNEYALKRIIGHKIDDLTEKTYTKRKREWLMEEILKIK